MTNEQKGNREYCDECGEYVAGYCDECRPIKAEAEAEEKAALKDVQMAALYGPAASYSDHKRGETIKFFDSDSGTVQSGVIEWVTAPSQAVEGGRVLPVTYVVIQEDAMFPSFVYPSDVIEQEPIDNTEVEDCCGACGNTVSNCTCTWQEDDPLAPSYRERDYASELEYDFPEE